MRILGIDHAKRTGWSLIENGTCIKTGYFNLTKDGEERLLEYKNKIEKVIDEIKPDKIAIEKPEHMRNGKVLQFLIGLYTINKLISLEKKIPAYEVHPLSMKRFITGNGKAKKAEVSSTLVERFGVDEELIIKPIINSKGTIRDFYYDESDATGLALFLYNNYLEPIKKYV